ncbi:MAG TPA: prolyl-tRNA synthetase associated domain-containing protein [Casimicrobiaceae bacterium]|nr:prolyl-tRNA synthetase associated domain-containing protein [Casimicrobiaceae bacterium]
MDLSAFLAQHGIDAKRFEHSPVMTVDESRRLVPDLPGAKTKNLFLRDKKGVRHILVTVGQDVAVDLNSLGLMLGAGRLGFASAERLRKYLGVSPGSVSLLALANDATHAVEFVLDRRLWEAAAVQAHPLVNDATMVIPHAQLERFLAATGHAAHIVDVPGRRETCGPSEP